MFGVGVFGMVQGPDDSVLGVAIRGAVNSPVSTPNLHGDGQVGPGWGGFGPDAPGDRVVDELMAQGDGV